MGSLQVKRDHDVVTLSASGAKTADGQSSSVRLPRADAFVFVLDVTNAATDADDTLDVTIQTVLDGTNWVDVVHFTQVLGNGADELTFVSKISRSLATAEFETGTALGAAAVRHLFGDEWRANWTIVDPTGSNVTFTFSITALPM